jgi:predicted AAA+ superfamily ATPase
MELKSRQVHAYIWDDELSQGKMVFLSGPRQIGKTSYARALLAAGQAGRYFNWDNAAVRRLYAKDPFFFLAGRTGEDPYLVVFDEIHKRPKWKDTL